MVARASFKIEVEFVRKEEAIIVGVGDVSRVEVGRARAKIDRVAGGGWIATFDASWIKGYVQAKIYAKEGVFKVTVPPGGRFESVKVGVGGTEARVVGRSVKRRLRVAYSLPVGAKLYSIEVSRERGGHREVYYVDEGGSGEVEFEFTGPAGKYTVVANIPGLGRLRIGTIEVK